MARTVRFEMQGLAAFGANLKQLAGPVAVKVCGQASGAAARVVRDGTKAQIRANPSIDTGSLLESVIVKKLRNPPEGLTASHIVTFRRGRSRRAKKSKTRQAIAPHAHFVERGTVNMPAEPSLGPGLANNVSKATTAIKDALGRGIKRETARMKK